MNSIGKLSEVGNVEIAAAILTDTPIEFKISDENIFEYEIVFVFYPMRVLTVGYVKNAIILSNPCTLGDPAWWSSDPRDYLL